MTIRRMTTIPLFTAMMIVFTIIVPPIPVPILNINLTLQTFIVMLAGLMLSPKDAFISVFLYVIIGALGFPVFSGLSGGMGVIIGPSGGFIVSFPIVAFLISYFKRKEHTFISRYLTTILLGIGVTYTIGSIWMVYYNLPIWGNVFFIPLDLLKGALAVGVSLRLEEYNLIYLKQVKTHNSL